MVIESELGNHFSLKDLLMVFSAGLMGNPRPTFKIEEKILKIIAQYMQKQIDEAKKDCTTLADQNRRI